MFIGLMNSDGAIWFRYQRAVLMICAVVCGIMQKVIKRPLKGNIPVIG